MVLGDRAAGRWISGEVLGAAQKEMWGLGTVLLTLFGLREGAMHRLRLSGAGVTSKIRFGESGVATACHSRHGWNTVEQ